jgi:hypothetical protein
MFQENVYTQKAGVGPLMGTALAFGVYALVEPTLSSRFRG